MRPTTHTNDTRTGERGFLTITAVTVVLIIGVAATLSALLTYGMRASGEGALGDRLSAQANAYRCAEMLRSGLWSDTSAASVSYGSGDDRCSGARAVPNGDIIAIRSEGQHGDAVARIHIEHVVVVNASGSLEAIAPGTIRWVANFD